MILRKTYGKHKPILDIPCPIDLPVKSYKTFLQPDIKPDERVNVGLQKLLKTAFPVINHTRNLYFDFVSYEVLDPSYTPEMCKKNDTTYGVVIKAKIRMAHFKEVPSTPLWVKEEDVVLGYIPTLTENGSFIINGVEKTVISQIRQAPGVYFKCNADKEDISYRARIIPQYGVWLDFEFDKKNNLFVRMDKNKKISLQTLLNAFGCDTEEILNTFYQNDILKIKNNQFYLELNPTVIVNRAAEIDIVNPATNELIAKQGGKIIQSAVKKIQALGLNSLHIPIELMAGKVLSKDIITEDGNKIACCGEKLTENIINNILKSSVPDITVLYFESPEPYIYNLFSRFSKSTTWECKINDYNKQRPNNTIYPATLTAYMDILSVTRPNCVPTVEEAIKNFANLFKSHMKYSLAPVGRYKINNRFGLSLDTELITKHDILLTVQHLLTKRDKKENCDDRDSLGNKIILAAGELVCEVTRTGIMESIRKIEDFSMVLKKDIDNTMPSDFIMFTPVTKAVKQFFNTSPFAQFDSQINPLAEVAHKRKITAIGPRGVDRDSADIAVRDVHQSHYGRICPIETPEGKNVGLVINPAVYMRVNGLGLIETPYRKVLKGFVTDQVVYLDAISELQETIASANTHIKNNKITAEQVMARKNSDVVTVKPEDVTMIDVSVSQITSLTTSLVPFFEHNDGHRALMAASMMKQAAPLMQCEPPLVGTGLESLVAKYSPAAVFAKNGGIVDYVSADMICVRQSDHYTVDTYKLKRFSKTNQDNCINQKPIVKKMAFVKKGDLLTDGYATKNGELALGKNLLVAFMPWYGYNFEDSIIINERLIKEDVLTSLHISEFITDVCETPVGHEATTRDIPNISTQEVVNLDKNGIVKIGCYVREGDILVGKIAPKPEIEPQTPEEILWRQVFGDSARDIKDVSLRVPPGVEGTVTDIVILNPDNMEDYQDKDVVDAKKHMEKEIAIVRNMGHAKILDIVRKSKKGIIFVFPDGKYLDINKIHALNTNDWYSIKINGTTSHVVKIKDIIAETEEEIGLIKDTYKRIISKLKDTAEISEKDVIKRIKVYIAEKRKISVGDKMSGRYGNKGIVSIIVPEEDMPVMPDGTHVDVVLNPCGIPSRMNIGQLLEVHLGMALKILGKEIEQCLTENNDLRYIREKIINIYNDNKITCFINNLTDKEVFDIAKTLSKGIPIATPSFDSIKEGDIKYLLDKAWLPLNGKFKLRDGKTGEYYDNEVTVGIMYMMKLDHMVQDKIHARAVGTYSAVSQQPLKGRAKFGGQRVGEMEMWALYAHGAAYIIREMCTVKSDTNLNREKIARLLVEGQEVDDLGLPEAFNVLTKELNSLGLDLQLKADKSNHSAGDS